MEIQKMANDFPTNILLTSKVKDEHPQEFQSVSTYWLQNMKGSKNWYVSWPIRFREGLGVLIQPRKVLRETRSSRSLKEKLNIGPRSKRIYLSVEIRRCYNDRLTLRKVIRGFYPEKKRLNTRLTSFYRCGWTFISKKTL